MASFSRCGKALILSGFVVACNGDSTTEPDDLDAGTFRASFSGSIVGTTEGTAAFGSPGPQLFLSLLDGPPQRNAINFIRFFGTRPAAGAYAIGATGEFGVFGTVDGNRSLVPADGTLTITASTADELRGTFTIDRRDAQGNVEFSVTGEFRARCSSSGSECN